MFCTSNEHLMIYYKTTIPPTSLYYFLYFAIKYLILTSGFSIMSYLQEHPPISQQDSIWKPEQKLWVTTITLTVPEGLPQQASEYHSLGS